MFGTVLDISGAIIVLGIAIWFFSLCIRSVIDGWKSWLDRGKLFDSITAIRKELRDDTK